MQGSPSPYRPLGSSPARATCNIRAFKELPPAGKYDYSGEGQGVFGEEWYFPDKLAKRWKNEDKTGKIYPLIQPALLNSTGWLPLFSGFVQPCLKYHKRPSFGLLVYHVRPGLKYLDLSEWLDAATVHAGPADTHPGPLSGKAAGRKRAPSSGYK